MKKVSTVLAFKLLCMPDHRHDICISVQLSKKQRRAEN